MDKQPVDALLVMLDELRRQRPAIYDADAWGQWEASIGQAIGALSTQAKRWAATVLVADDLCQAMPGLPLSLAYQRIQDAVMRQTGRGGAQQEHWEVWNADN